MQEQNFNKVFSKRLRYYLNQYEMTQAEFAKKMGVGTTSVYNWCNGIKVPRMDKVDIMCKLFHCTRSDLVEDKQPPQKRKGVVIKVLGNVAAGIPIEAIEDVVDEEEISEELARTGQFFGLKIKGDSMQPRICEGDTVIVRQQDDAESGDIVIALVNGNDATCKRLRKYHDGIELVSNNPNYEPMFFSNDEVISKPVKIIGKVVENRQKY